MREIEDSLKTFRDLKNSLDTAEEKGRAEGIEIVIIYFALFCKGGGHFAINA